MGGIHKWIEQMAEEGGMCPFLPSASLLELGPHIISPPLALGFTPSLVLLHLPCTQTKVRHWPSWVLCDFWSGIAQSLKSHTFICVHFNFCFSEETQRTYSVFWQTKIKHLKYLNIVISEIGLNYTYVCMHQIGFLKSHTRIQAMFTKIISYARKESSLKKKRPKRTQLFSDSTTVK